MNALLRLQLELSKSATRLDDAGFEPLCAVLARMAKAPETPRAIRKAIRRSIDRAHAEPDGRAS